MGLLQSADHQDLFVFSHGLPSAQKKQLLRDALQAQGPATLICSENWIPSPRVLVLDNAPSLDESFLKAAASVCSRFRLTPVVLSIAGSERAARLRQHDAIQILAACSVTADFDYFVGYEVRAGVAQIARWRHCQMVIGQHEAGGSWRRWFRDTTVEEFMGVPEGLSFLALPKRNGLAGLSNQTACKLTGG